MNRLRTTFAAIAITILPFGAANAQDQNSTQDWFSYISRDGFDITFTLDQNNGHPILNAKGYTSEGISLDPSKSTLNDIYKWLKEELQMDENQARYFMTSIELQASFTGITIPSATPTNEHPDQPTGTTPNS